MKTTYRLNKSARTAFRYILKGLFIWRLVIPVSGLAQLPRQIISCVYMLLFIPSTGRPRHK